MRAAVCWCVLLCVVCAAYALQIVAVKWAESTCLRGRICSALLQCVALFYTLQHVVVKGRMGRR